LLAIIKNYLDSRGSEDTTGAVSLIPSSAHGTNAASAVIAGLKGSGYMALTQMNLEMFHWMI
jgi:glycine cleavage system protein P-like pyridoxal-binding family